MALSVSEPKNLVQLLLLRALTARKQDASIEVHSRKTPVKPGMQRDIYSGHARKISSEQMPDQHPSAPSLARQHFSTRGDTGNLGLSHCYEARP